jgi:transketolase
MDAAQLAELGQQLRVDSVRSSAAAGSGHPTSSMSAADLIAVLIAEHLRFDVDNPENPNNDHLIFSKGHASPLEYSMLKAVGIIDDDELLTFRKHGSRLQGHPVPNLPMVDVATGSLGLGLPIGVGVALTGKRLDQLPYRVWVLCGDSELAEGSMWEAFEHASYAELDNLIAILDINRLGQRGETMHGWDLANYTRRVEANGWHAIEVDGHNIPAILDAYESAVTTVGKPTAIIARTLKGKGVKAVENKNGFHGKPLEDPDAAIEELGGERDIHVDLAKPESSGQPHRFDAPGGELPSYDVGGEVATRKAYGEALTALGSMDGAVVALDGEVGNSTYAEIFHEAHPGRYFEMFIAEQQMVAAAIGMQVRKWKPFASTFAAFFSRAADFIRMAAISRADLRLSGSHAGVSIGEDGPSQMAMEDIAFFRAVHSTTVLYPCDANQAAKLTQAMAELDGISYLRTTRGNTPVIYGPDEAFEIGGSRVVRESETDEVLLVGAGITLHEALKAADALAEDGISARVVDCYSVKPIDVNGLRGAAAEAGGRVVVAEDHYPEGGLGDAVLEAFGDVDIHARVVRLGVSEMPGSGKPAELLADAGIDAGGIAEAASALVRGGVPV